MSRHIANALARMRRFEPILAYAVADEDLRAVPEIVADNYAGEACLRNAIGLADCHDEARHDEARGDLAVIVRLYQAAKAWHALRAAHVREALDRLKSALEKCQLVLGPFESEAPMQATRDGGAPAEMFAIALVQQQAAAARRNSLVSALKSQGMLRYLSRSDFVSVADGMLKAMGARRWYAVTAEVSPNWPLRRLVELGEFPPSTRHSAWEPKYSDDPDAWRNFGDLLAPIFRNPVTALKAEIATLEAAAKDALQAYAAEQDGRLAAATPAEVLCLACSALLAHNVGRERITGGTTGTICKAYGALLPIIDGESAAAEGASLPDTAIRAVTRGRDSGKLALDAFDQVRDPFAEHRAFLAYEAEMSRADQDTAAHAAPEPEWIEDPGED